MTYTHYIAATKNSKHYYIEGVFTPEDVERYTNAFDIDEFIEKANDEFTGPPEGTYYFAIRDENEADGWDYIVHNKKFA